MPALSLAKSPRRTTAALAAAAVMSASAPAQAQHGFPLAVEARGGLTVPPPCILVCGDYPSGGDAGLREIDAEVNVHPRLSLYGAYASYGLREDENQPPDRAWGYAFGLRFRIAPSRPVGAWVRAGLLRHRRTIRWSVLPDTVATSDWGSGSEYGVGLTLRVLPLLSLSPGIRHQSYGAAFDTGGNSGLPPKMSRSTSFFVFDLGVRLGR